METHSPSQQIFLPIMTEKKGDLAPVHFNDNVSSANDAKKINGNEKYDIFYVYRMNNNLNKFFGLQKITYDGDHVKAVGTVVKLYALVLVALVSTNCYFIIKDLRAREGIRDIIMVINILSNLCTTITTSVSILISAFLVSPFMLRALKGIGPVDEKLGIKGNQRYVYLRRRVMVAQLLVIAMGASHFTYENIVGMEGWSMNLRSFSMHLVNLSIYIQLLDFSTLVWIIVTRLKTFNSQLIQLTTDENEPNKLPIETVSFSNEINFGKSPDNFLEAKIRNQIKYNQKNKSENLVRLMKAFDEIADVVNIISSCFGLSILFTSAMTFLYIISTVNGLIMFEELVKTDTKYSYIYIILWCLPFTMCLVIAAYVSEMMKKEIDKTNSYIDKLTINTEQGTKNSELVENFAQLLSVREVNITASNFFPFDMTFVLSLVGAVATYTVLLMQVKPPKLTVPLTNGTFSSNFTNVTAA